MSDPIRRLQKLKEGIQPLATTTPTANSMTNGESRYALINGKLRLYTKQQGILWYNDSFIQVR